MKIKEIIELVLEQVCEQVDEQGWTLIDEYTNGDTEKAVKRVYDAIKDEIY